MSDRWFALVIGVVVGGFGLLASSPVIAGLCPTDTVTRVHRTEAVELESADFSLPSTCTGTPGCVHTGCPPNDTECFVGTRAYNRRVLGCNRSRDIDVIRFGPINDIPFVHKPAGKVLDERNAEERRFANNLAPRMVTGKYRYLGAFKKWYGYLLERQAGEWIVTVTLDFEFPEKEPDKLHIPPYLMDRLSTTMGGATLGTTTCSTRSTSDETDGLIRVKRNGVLTDRSCRVGRSDQFFLAIPDSCVPGTDCFLPASLGTTTSKPATEWVMLFWREVITQIWSRTNSSFRMVVNIANFVGRPGEITRDELDLYRGGNVVFEIDFHHNEKRWNNMFRPIVVGGEFYKAIYPGEDNPVVAHEFGHSLGLGDDYPGKANPPADKDCEALSGQDTGDQFRYAMCDNGFEPQDAKSVYLWIVTQRYSIGKDLYCGDDEDCDNGEFCRAGGLTGHSECRAQKEVGNGCSRPGQCLSGFCPAADLLCAECTDDDHCGDNQWCASGTPLSANTCKAKRGIGGDCSRQKQCSTGLCPAIDLLCAECTGDGDCDDGEFCEAGTPAKTNRCQAQHRNGESCTRPNQCQSGLCPVLDLKCAECTDDDHCDSDEFCKEGVVLSQNSCEPKKRNGESCSRPNQCQSDLCPAIDLKCAECTDDNHCDNNEYCNAGAVLSQNQCKSKKSNGSACTRPNQCTSGLCPVQDLVCVECTSNSHCDSDEYCDKGTVAGFGVNDCKNKKNVGQSCSKDSMCKSNCCKYMALEFHSECRPSNKCN